VLVVKQPPHADAVVRWSRALVVIDGSPGADITMEYALTLAQAEHLDVYLLHVKAAWAPGKARHSLVRAQATCTLAAAQAVAAGVHYETRIAAGHSVPAILETAAYCQCDVIILGIHEGTHWQRLWRGHLPRVVTTQTAFPVLLVPSLPGVPAAVSG
jgi:nucleotide-binding universal stress UspA family protein